MFKKRIDFICTFWLSNIDNLGKGVKDIVSPDNEFLRFSKFIKQIFKSIYRLFKPSISNVKGVSTETLTYIQSINNLNASININNKLKNVSYLISNNEELMRNVEQSININFKYTLFYQLFQFFSFIKILRNREYRRIYNIIFEAIGLYECSIRILKNLDPKNVVFYNDHSLKARALLMACKELNIKAVYIQHAPVTKYFPALDFDISLLDGDYSEKVYKNHSSQIYKVFPERFLKYINARKIETNDIRTIGIAFNELDSLKKVKEIAFKLERNLQVSILIRPHPADKRNIEEIGKFSWSNIDTSSNSLTFLKQINLLISGDSGIHLEACLMNIPSISFNMALESQLNDSFDFDRNKISYRAKSIDDITYYIKNLKPDRVHYKKAKPYVDLDAPLIEELLVKLIT